MKKLLVFFSFFLISTGVYAVDFFPYKKVVNFPDSSEENENLIEYKFYSYDCSLGSSDSNIWDYCIAINGEIKNQTENYQNSKANFR